ncbi:MAG: LON peptidase substrate-binding domain-containing protein [Sulfuricellaceae bacterium]|nr:LON peptidase substrate-binding domain-containing protein [Sulfuricellaceae bacterium]
MNPLDLGRRILAKTARNDTFELPLFPLNTVLFPGGILPLKVFEPRYVELVSDCMREEKPFGINLIRAGQETGAPADPEPVGCLASISSWDMPELGILQIQVTGGLRFFVEHSHVEANGLVLASASTIAEEPPLALPAKYRACADMLKRIIDHLGHERFQTPFKYDDTVWVGYRLAELLPLKRSARQNMLEMNDSLVRIEILHSFLVRQGLIA